MAETVTPRLVLDLARFRANCERMSAMAEARGVALRPHVKTHRTVAGAVLQTNGPHSPVHLILDC